jgi:hypothetical protein
MFDVFSTQIESEAMVFTVRVSGKPLALRQQFHGFRPMMDREAAFDRRKYRCKGLNLQ